MGPRQRIVVVGGGLAGLRAAEALRSGGFDGTVTLVGEEHHRPYNRPPLSKQLLAGQSADPWLPTEDLAAEQRLGVAARGLDPRRRTVHLADGTRLRYDGLVIATGARARTWPWPVPVTGVHTLRTLEDARALYRAVEPSTRVVIVGGGFLGSEAAAALRTLTADAVHLVFRGAAPLTALGPEIGDLVAARHRAHGVDLHPAATVAAITGTDRVRGVVLADGTELEADVVLLALGAVPNTDWLEGSGLLLHRGRVLCGPSCAVLGAERIVAAGDVAAWQDPTTGRPRHLEHWSHAVEMGQAAAATLLGSGTRAASSGPPLVYDPVPTFWTDQWDLRIRAAGWLEDATSLTVAEEDHARGRLVVEGHRAGELVAALTVNRPRTHIEYQRTLAARHQLREAPAV